MAVQASRKFDELVKFYKSMMKDAKSEKVRMDAATQLDALWARQQHYAERAATRKERAELRAMTAQGQGAAIRVQEPIQDDADERAREVFARFLTPKGKNDGADAD